MIEALEVDHVVASEEPHEAVADSNHAVAVVIEEDSE